MGSPVRADDPPAGHPVRLANAGQSGGVYRRDRPGRRRRVADPAVGDVLKLDYTLPAGTAAGAWAKAFPTRPGPDTADVLRLAVRGDAAAGTGAVTAAIEVKGTAGVQRIPVTIGTEWDYHEVAVDWPAVGHLQEVVVSVSPAVGAGAATGTVFLDVRFERLSAPAGSARTRPAGSAGSRWSSG